MRIVKIFLFLLPLLEIAGFIVVGGWIGVLPTLLLIICTTILGFAILRIKGFMTLMQIQRQINAGEHPRTDVMDISLLMFGGFLLIIPGFITDIAGLLLLIPALRVFILRKLVAGGVLAAGKGEAKPKPPSGRVIEGEFKREDKKKDWFKLEIFFTIPIWFSLAISGKLLTHFCLIL